MELIKEKAKPGNGKYTFLFILVALIILATVGVVKAIDWGHTYQLQTPWVIDFNFDTRKWYKEIKREEIKPVIEVIEQSDIEIENPIDKKIYELWGDRYFLLARSVFKCESGLNPEAVNWTTRDIGVAQINWPIWEKPVKEKFGYTLTDMFDYEKNLEVAHWIWDRDGDGQGSFEPWVVFNNGSFIGCVE